jgi:hypothetical protein
MPEESVRELVRHVRAVLQQKGALGAFLLSELDASISRGVEEVPSNYHDQIWRAEEIIGRRAPSEEELLQILTSTLHTYLFTLPATADSLSKYLREHYGIQQVEITLDPSLLDEERQATGRAQIDAIVPRIQDGKAIVALKELIEVVADVKRPEE